MRVFFISIGCIFLCPCTHAQVLFDATKAEMAGNADWVIDADLHNLGVSTGAMGSGQIGGGNESNPQRIPNPGYGNITANSPENTWNGGLSAWGISLVKAGYKPETLSYNQRITYGNSKNAQDLSHYKMYVVCEPNILFTAAEKKAILNYVADGGSLFMISDHSGSDRNNDGNDPVEVWNDLLNNNGIAVNPFGITFNNDTVTPPSPFADPAASNLRTHGSYGAVTDFAYASGATMTINTAKNSSVVGDVWSSSARSSSSVMFATATYGFGRIAAAGDSSPFDDGTGDSNDTLFNGWDDASGNDRRLIMNASMWLLNHPADGVPEPTSIVGIGCGIALFLRGRRRLPSGVLR